VRFPDCCSAVGGQVIRLSHFIWNDHCHSADDVAEASAIARAAAAAELKRYRFMRSLQMLGQSDWWMELELWRDHSREGAIRS